MPPEPRPPRPARPRRIVCYAVNGAGLGHVIRLLHLARWMRRIVAFVDGRPPEIIFLTSTEATQLIADAGFAAFKLPSKGTARKCQLDVTEFRRLARQFVWQVLSDFSPDLLVVDTFAQGSLDELFPILDAPYARALVLRRIKPTEARRPIFQASYRFYDAVVFPHERDEVATLLAELPPAPPPAFVGPIFFDAPEPAQRKAQRASTRAELGLGDATRLIYVSAGGGGDPHAEAVLSRLVAAVTSAAPDAAILVGAGPLYRGRRIFAPQVIWSSDPGIARYFVACDAALAAAGYNSFHELAAAGVPTAFFGLEKIADDQDERVRRLESLGACVRLTYPLVAGEVEAAVTSLLSPARASALSEAARLAVGRSNAASGAAALLQPLLGSEAERALACLPPGLVASTARLGASADTFIAEVLPRLLPDVGASPSDRAAIARLIATLSPFARAEVEARLSSLPDDLSQVTTDLASFLESIPADTDPTLVLAAFDAILRRHTRANADGAPFAGAVIAGLTRVFVSSPADAFQLEQRVALLKAFPALADTDLAGTFDAFFAFLANGAARGEDAPTLIRRLQLARTVGGPMTPTRFERIFEWVL